MRLQHLGNLRVRIIQITKYHSLCIAGSFNTQRLFSSQDTAGAEITFFHNTTHPGGELTINLLDKGHAVLHTSWIAPVKTPGAVGAGRHAETATDATMEVHHYKTFRTFVGCLGRTGPDTGRIITVITGYQEAHMVQFRILFIMTVLREGMGIRFFPYPLDLILFIAVPGNIIIIMTGINTFLGKTRSIIKLVRQ